MAHLDKKIRIAIYLDATLAHAVRTKLLDEQHTTNISKWMREQLKAYVAPAPVFSKDPKVRR